MAGVDFLVKNIWGSKGFLAAGWAGAVVMLVRLEGAGADEVSAGSDPNDWTELER